MRLICYPTSGAAPRIVTAPVERDWMDRSIDAFAYRCLPLDIANAHGWLILNDEPFMAQWTGGVGPEAVTLQRLGRDAAPLLGMSHFGHGVLTFGVNGLFRTEPGYDLMVTGPANRPKDGIQALTGLVETDWSPFTFTMNWKFTRKLTPVVFERNEPFCMIYPVERRVIEAVEPEFRPMSEDPEVEAAYLAWAERRRNFNDDLTRPGSEAQRIEWQKDYFRGETPFGVAPADHRTRLRLKAFKTPG